MAWAPPTLKTRSTPHSRATVNTAGSALPSGLGGVHMIRNGQPAMRAGMASISAVDGSGAVPAGTYSPTACNGTMRRSQMTPGEVSTRKGGSTWASWNAVMVPIARRIAAICATVKDRSADSNSSAETANDASSTPSKRAVISRNAASPRVRTSSTMRAVRWLSAVASRWAGRRKARARPWSSSADQTEMFKALLMRASSLLAGPGLHWHRLL